MGKVKLIVNSITYRIEPNSYTDKLIELFIQILTKFYFKI